MRSSPLETEGSKRWSQSTRRALSSLTLSNNFVRPIADVFGSRTSRIQLRNPSLQNIRKRFRKLIQPRAGRSICYVDFDQYEVGIMGALSGDEALLKLYRDGDMYQLFASEYLGLQGNRKAAKQLFLSYAYGMSRKALIDAAVSLGAQREAAKTAFRSFSAYESWKEKLEKEFVAAGRIGTALGNYFNRTQRGPLSAKERRSIVSQVVQGTASLIFKKTINATAKLNDVTILLPMHDALLFEYS
ncbi:MAG: DNA polymerase [Rhodoblastus sp.]|uniref:DNA polymerase n=1 Tax=Rhodoblastus sp. TaxID=1962975 RepID=UPI003F9C9CE9